jgi:hypothetical protein
MLSGVADLILDCAVAPWHGLRIEFKSTKGRLSKEQNNFINKELSAGYLVEVVRTEKDGIELINRYLNGEISYVDKLTAQEPKGVRSQTDVGTLLKASKKLEKVLHRITRGKVPPTR